jgi:hypothetical protein
MDVFCMTVLQRVLRGHGKDGNISSSETRFPRESDRRGARDREVTLENNRLKIL